MKSNGTKHDAAIAVVGASALYPGAVDAPSFWRNIMEGGDFMTEIPADHWLIEDYYDPDPRAPGKIYARRGGFIPKVDFDPIQHGLPPKQLSTTDTAQLLALIMAQRVLDDASSVQFQKVKKSDISVILGVASATELVGQMAARIQRPNWVNALRNAGLPESQVEEVCDHIEATYPEWDESTFPGLLGNVVAGRIANRLDLGGTNCVIDAACASSLGAVAMAVQELTLGHSDLVITGGVDALNDIFMYMCFSKTPALSATGDCRPFSDAADGTMLGEGIGMLALRRLADAERDGDKIYAVLRGVGSSSDGRAKSIYAPRAEGQQLAIRRAYERAGFQPEEVQLVEAHGTATKAGDAAEFSGLCQAFGTASNGKTQWCALGSVKSQIGHTKSAAGAASMFKVVMALHHKVLPPTIKVEQPNSKMEIQESPFYLSTRARPWIRAEGQNRRAGVSSFGFGGSNFHIAMEEYSGGPSAARRYSSLPVHLLLLGAPSPDALRASISHTLEQLSESTLPAVARTSQEAFQPEGTHRLALLVKDEAEAQEELARAAQRIQEDGSTPFSLPNRVHYQVGESPGPLAYLFPGQGSQYVDMGSELAMEFESARQAWDAAAEWEPVPGERLHDVVFPIPVFSDEAREEQEARLTQTEWAQPAIGATSLSMLRLLDQVGVRASATAGHSYGELPALLAGGVVKDEETLLRLSRKRGELMAAASSTPGAMLAVRGGREAVSEVLAAHPDVAVTIANVNSPKQVVVAGSTSQVEAIREKLEAAKLASRPLPVATAFHTELVADSAKPFADFLEGVSFQSPRIPVYSNTHAVPYGTSEKKIRGTLAHQLAKPVNFLEMVRKMHDDGIRIFVEVGPGSALTGLVSDCLSDRPHLAVPMDNRKLDGRVGFLNALALLSVHGVPVDFAALWEEFAPFPVPVDAATLSPATVQLNGANFGKPYPPAEGAAGRALPNPEPAPEKKAPPPPQTSAASHSLEAPAASSSAAADPAAAPAPTPPAEPRQKPAPPPSAEGPSSDWATSFQLLQEQTLEAQKAFTQALSTSHEAFLRASEVAFTQLGQMGSVDAAPTSEPAPRAAVAPKASSPVATKPPTPVPPQPAEAPPAPEPPPRVDPVQPGLDPEALLMEVVAEKTGYPASMLTLDMELEAGLGIDSIKRVEILSALQEKIPELADVDTGRLAALNTLGEIVDFAAAAMPDLAAGDAAPARAPTLSSSPSSADSPAPASASSPASSSAAPSQPSAEALDPEALLMEVVAEKTGYPASMLTLDMELEAGLGIDSIKRVEILSALQEKIPELADVDTGRLAALNTLGEIVDFAAAAMPDLAAGDAAPAQAPTIPPAPPSAEALDPEALLMEVVAEKTGYPASMLTLDMELEAGLGIDSIKRVEILSALQEKIPELADVDTGRLAALNTLGEIVDFAAAAVPGLATDTAPSDTDHLASPSRELELHRMEVGLRESPASGLVTPGLLDASPLYLVAGSQQPVASALAEQLEEVGVSVQITDSPPPNAEAVVILSALDPRGSTPQDQAELNGVVFRHLKACAETMAAQGGLLVTVQTTGGDFGMSGSSPSSAWAAGISAAARTAALEWSSATVRALDLAVEDSSPQELAERLRKELFTGGRELEVGLTADGSRWTPQVTITPGGTDLDSQARSAAGTSQQDRTVVPVDPRGVVLVSGGARGVTAACLEALLSQHPVPVAVLGRTPLKDEPAGLETFSTDAELKQALLARASSKGEAMTPQELGSRVKEILAQREIRENLSRFSRLGAQVRYVSVDVSHGKAVAEAVSTVRREMGPIKGLIHAAGVLADKEIRLKTDEQFTRVVRTKVNGFQNLLNATRDDDLTHIACFSSVAARFGNVGQVDYAMANEVLNRVCQAEARRRGEGCRVKALGWGPWAGGMVDPSLEKHFAAMGVALIPLEEGARFFVREYTGANGDAVEVLFGGGLGHFGGGSGSGTAAGQNGSGTDTAKAHVWFHESTFAYVDSHVIRGTPVVPMVTANSLALHAVAARFPHEEVVGTRGLQVVKGIQLHNFRDEGDLYLVECTREPGSHAVKVRIVSPEGAVHYTLEVVLGSGDGAASNENGASGPKLLTNLRSWEPKSGSIYDGRLFHGPLLQVIRQLEGISEDGCTGRLEAALPSREGYSTNLDILDGGLQLAVLWVHEHEEQESLPMGMDGFHLHRSWEWGQPVLCQAEQRSRTSLMTRWDLHFSTEEGDPLCTMEGVRIHLVPPAEGDSPRDKAVGADVA